MPGNMRVRLVLTNHSRKERIKKAAEAIQNAGLPTERVDESSVMSMSDRDDHMYVCDPFEGQAFDHLVQLGCRIVGPQCVMSCLDKEMAVPKVNHPIYSISMHRVSISCSSIEKNQRDKIHKLVEWMGGTVSKNFTDTVTHLIAGEVGSKKYHVAASLKTPVMLPDWVFSCWERGKDRYLCGTDEDLIREFTCPIFKGCVICVTGVEGEERQDIRILTDENGGQYTGEMKFNECTHLIVNSPKGAKYEFARKWKIHCVTSKWFFDGISLGYCQDENLYQVESQVRATSTPNRSDVNMNARPSLANFSAISNLSMPTGVDDTAMTDMSTTYADTTVAAVQQADMKELDDLDLTVADAELFLDGCKVFLSGFAGPRLEKLRKIINAGGGTRFNQINESVSHVVMGDRVPDHISLLMQSSLRPHVVTASWLVDSFKQSCHLPEESYTCLNLPPVTSASPASHSKSKKQRPSSVAGTSRGRDRREQPAKDEEEDADTTSMMQQYLPGKSDPNETTNDSEIVFKMPQERRNQSGVKDAVAVDDEDETQMDVEEVDEEDVTILEEIVDGVFSTKSFVILGFPPDQEEQILEMIIDNGGKVRSITSRGVPDFAIVPITGCEVDVSVGEVVTNCWLQMCIEEARFLEPVSNPLFSPIPISESDGPLDGCVLTVSQFTGAERDCLVHIAELLGATCQEFFSRKVTNELKANTHLLLREASGSKYKATKKWKIPAVTKEWLLDAASKNKKQPEKKYLVDRVTDQQDDQFARQDPPTATETRLTLQAPQQLDAAEDPSASKQKEVREEFKKPVQSTVPPVKDTAEKAITKAEGALLREDPLDCQTEPRTNLVDVGTDENVARGHDRAKDPKLPSDSDKENKQGVAERDTPKDTPIVNKHIAAVSSGAVVSKDTPSKFLREGVVFHPAFDTKDALDYLESPAGVHHKRRHARKSSLPLDDFFHMNVAKAIQKTGEQAADEEADETVFQEPVATQGILAGTVICVSKKLIAKQGEYNAAAVSLGAEFRWTFDDTCTHFIFKGRTNDTSKEFRMAKDKGIFIVSPFWLLACEEEERRVDEAGYPHTFNPKMSLSVLSTRHSTPARTPARTTRQTRSMARTPCAPPQPPPPRPALSPPRPQPQQTSLPPQPHDEAAMDGFEEGSTDSDEELLRVAEAAERGEGEEGATEKSGLDDNGEGSLEQRENLQKQLEGIMSSTTNNKGGRRRSRIHKNSTSSTSNVSSNSTTTGRERPGSSRRTRSSRAMTLSEDDGQGGKNRALAVRPPELHQEASQNVQITWDDPAGRMEREKIMAHLKRSCSPTQNSADAEDGQMAMMREEISPDKSRVTLQRQGSGMTDAASHRDDLRDDLPSPTPRAPPIRLPALNLPVAPHPVEMAVADPEPEDKPKPQPKFLLSGMSQDEKIDYSALIEQLGGVVKDGMYFDPSCTHIVVGNPTRNEKYLASLATGKWVLHKSYFEACRKAGDFVEEEAHEWGSATDLSSVSGQTAKLALAAYRWRQELQQLQQGDDGDGKVQGAFTGWRVFLYIDRSKEASFKRILLAGGAEVMGLRPPFNNLRDVTHAFMDLAKTKTPEGVLDLEAMVSSGILCLKPEYIAEFLMQDPAPDHTNYFINEVKPIIERIYNAHEQSRTPSKRKRLDDSSRSKNKKGRLR